MSKIVQDVETDHEYDGIKEFDNPLPRWWLWTFAITVLFSVYYWLTRETLPAEGTFEEFQTEYAEFEAKALAQAVEPAELEAMVKDTAAVAAGQTTFSNKCASCHGEKAEGGTGPNLTDRFWLHGSTTREIYVSIASGYPKLGMPKWRGQLEDRAIQELTAYVLSIRNTNVQGKGPQGTEAAL